MGKFKQLAIELESDLHLKLDRDGHIVYVNGLPIAKPVVAHKSTTDDTTEINRAAFRAYLTTEELNQKEIKPIKTEVSGFWSLENDNTKTKVM